MMISKISVIIGGIFSLLMVIFHTQFYKLFNWKEDFGKISARNQRIFYTIHIALYLFFIIFAILSFVYTDELSQCRGLAFGIMLGYALFWLWRTVWQVIYFKPPKTRKDKDAGKLLFLHYLLIIIFLILFLAYGIPVVISLSS
jgi:cytochrome b561